MRRLAIAVIALGLLAGAVLEFGPLVLTYLVHDEIRDSQGDLQDRMRCTGIDADVRLADGTAVVTNTGQRTVNGTLRTFQDGTVTDTASLSLEPQGSGSLAAPSATNATFTVTGCDHVFFPGR